LSGGASAGGMLGGPEGHLVGELEEGNEAEGGGLVPPIVAVGKGGAVIDDHDFCLGGHGADEVKVSIFLEVIKEVGAGDVAGEVAGAFGGDRDAGLFPGFEEVEPLLAFARGGCAAHIPEGKGHAACDEIVFEAIEETLVVGIGERYRAAAAGIPERAGRVGGG